LNEISLAESRAAAEQAFDHFLLSYEAKYPKATECLAKDREHLLTFLPRMSTVPRSKSTSKIFNLTNSMRRMQVG
jgi:transposase-like protein